MLNLPLKEHDFRNVEGTFSFFLGVFNLLGNKGELFFKVFKAINGHKYSILPTFQVILQQPRDWNS